MARKQTYLLTKTERDFLVKEIEMMQQIRIGNPIQKEMSDSEKNYHYKIKNSVINTIENLDKNLTNIYTELLLLRKYYLLLSEISENNNELNQIHSVENDWNEAAIMILNWYPHKRKEIIDKLLLGSIDDISNSPLKPIDVLIIYRKYLNNTKISDTITKLIQDDLIITLTDFQKELNLISLLPLIESDNDNKRWCFTTIDGDLRDDFYWITGQLGIINKLPNINIIFESIINKSPELMEKQTMYKIQFKYNIALDILISSIEGGFINESFTGVQRIHTIYDLIEWVFNELKRWKIYIIKRLDGSIGITQDLSENIKSILQSMNLDCIEEGKIMGEIGESWSRAINRIQVEKGIGPWIITLFKEMQERKILMNDKKMLVATDKGRRLHSFILNNFQSMTELQWSFLILDYHEIN